MAKKQTWRVVLDGVAHTLTYTRPTFGSCIVFQLDGDRFELPRGAREEPFRLGDEQAVLCIHRNGKASVRLRDIVLEESK